MHLDTTRPAILQPGLPNPSMLTALSNEITELINGHLGDHVPEIFRLTAQTPFSPESRASLKTQGQEAVLWIREGSLRVASAHGTRQFPQSSILTAPLELLEHGGTIVGDNPSGAEVAVLPRTIFEEWLAADPKLASALAALSHLVHPQTPFPTVSRNMMRETRDDNIETLITRKVLKVVSGQRGLMNILNPTSCNVKYFRWDSPEPEELSPVEQTWRIIWGVVPVMLHQKIKKIEGIARDCVQSAGSLFPDEPQRCAASALMLFEQKLLSLQEKVINEISPRLVEALDKLNVEPSRRAIFFERILQIDWLQYLVSGKKLGDRSAHEERLLKSLIPAPDSIVPPEEQSLHTLDYEIERLFEAAQTKKHPELLSIAFEDLPASYSLGSSSRAIPYTTAQDHPHLVDLEARLDRGEESAVGGKAYAQMRFPHEALEALAAGKSKAILFDGTRENGISFVRHQFGRNAFDSGLLDPCTIIRLQGAYGSFERSLINFRDGSSYLLVAHTGKARQDSNAGALLLYRDRKSRIPLTNLILAAEPTTILDRISSDLDRAMHSEKLRIAGDPVLKSIMPDLRMLMTQVVILQHPQQLIESLGSALISQADYHCFHTGSLKVAYWISTHGLFRLLVPTVGGAGLYGDTPGLFLKAVERSKHFPKLSPHVLFSASAGGVAGTIGQFRAMGLRGLPPRSKDLVVMPRTEVHSPTGVYSIKTLFDYAESHLSNLLPVDQETVRRSLRALDEMDQNRLITFTDRHQSILAPAFETFEVIDESVGRGCATIDCEAGSIAEHIFNASSPSRFKTFTPLYVVSDDPSAARKRTSEALAYGAPIIEAEPNRTVIQAHRCLLDSIECLHGTPEEENA